MKALRYSAILLLLLGTTAAARGDVVGLWTQADTASLAKQPAADTNVPAASIAQDIVPPDSRLWAETPAVRDAQSLPHEGDLKQLPPAPNSLALFLSAVAPLGAWRVTRSIRSVHLGNVPDWYHAGGPAQIGHASPVDLDFASIPVCRTASPVEPPSAPISHLQRREPPNRLPSQTTLTVAAPRAPPHCA